MYGSFDVGSGNTLYTATMAGYFYFPAARALVMDTRGEGQAAGVIFFRRCGKARLRLRVVSCAAHERQVYLAGAVK